MTSDVVLTAALRNNLLSLQNTQSAINATQFQLSTGKKVNSALDNPQSFFAAQSLNNRASDLTKLLDSIGQSIEVIKAADNGVTALTSLVNQAQALAQTAQTAVTSGSTQAAATGTASLTGSTQLNTLSGFSATGDTVAISITDPAAGTLVVDGTSALGSIKGGLITTQANWTVQDLIDNINDINSRSNATVANQPLSTPAVSASLDSSGHLSIAAINGGTLRVQFIGQANNSARTTTSLDIAASLGFNGIAKIDQNGSSAGNTDTVSFMVRTTAAITSNKLYVNAAGTLADASTLLSQLEDSSGNSLVGNGATTTLNAADSLKLKIGGKTSGDLLHYTSTGGQSYSATTSTVGSLIDAINHDTTINNLVTATFDTTNGQISITSKDPSATDVQFQFSAVGGTVNDTLSKVTAVYANGIGFGTQPLTTAANQSLAQETVRFGAAAGQLASLQTQYGTVLSQIDSLVTNGDTGYQGTNLLNGDNLLTTFNESRTSTLTTAGIDFSSNGLGLKAANFGNVTNVGQSLTQITAALNTVRNYGSSLSTDLSVIQTRQTFTNSLITTLQEGAGNLVNADQNAEGATLLALQTRQSLGVTALSLASQSNQSILRLFQ